ncbi:MAG: hypothetical protein RQ867_00800 [Mariprofundaceae bacterium]|nr:hypothetical protein [Mariprofundaceae bacterium]
MWNTIKKYTRWGAFFVDIHAVGTYTWPFLVSIIGAILLWAQGSPIGYIYIGTVFTFASIVFGLFSFSRWRYYRDPEWKLRFSGGRCVFNERTLLDNEGVDICLGINVNSIAEFPIAFRVESLEVSIGNYINSDTNPNFSEIVVPAMGIGYQNGPFIKVPKQEIEKGVLGKMNFKLKYGREGSLKYEIKKSQLCEIYFGTNGEIKYAFYDSGGN